MDAPTHVGFMGFECQPYIYAIRGSIKDGTFKSLDRGPISTASLVEVLPKDEGDAKFETMMEEQKKFMAGETDLAYYRELIFSMFPIQDLLTRREARYAQPA